MVVNCRKDNQLKWRLPIVFPLKPCNDVTLQVVQGRTMEEWLRFSVVYWHTFRGTGLDPFGGQTLYRHWEDGTDSVDNAKRRLRAAFEFMSKLGVKYWTYHDRYRMHHQFHGSYSICLSLFFFRDIAPEGATLAESNANLDEVSNLAQELMQKTGIKLLWATCNLFSHPRQE